MDSEESTQSRSSRFHLASAVVGGVVGAVVASLVVWALVGGDLAKDAKPAVPPSQHIEVTTPEVDHSLGEPVELTNVGVDALPEGEAGEIAIVARGPLGQLSGSMPIVLRNNTDAPLTRLSLSAEARDAGGSLIASGEDQRFTPNLVPVGGLAIGYVYFGEDADLPSGTDITFDVSGINPSDNPRENIRDLKLDEVNLVGERIIGSVENQGDSEVTGPIGVNLLCFASDGQALQNEYTFANHDTLPAGASSPFNLDLLGAECPTFLVGAQAFKY